MNRPDFATRARRVAAIMLAIALSATAGAGIARWTLHDTNGFYMAPVDGYGTPAYARRQPIADTFWDRQDGGAASARQADGISTATSAQPAYRSASGS